MKTITFLALLLLSVSSVLLADTYSRQRVGNMDIYSGSNGYYGTGQQNGHMYNYSDNKGNNINCQWIGHMEICN